MTRKPREANFGSLATSINSSDFNQGSNYKYDYELRVIACRLNLHLTSVTPITLGKTRKASGISMAKSFCGRLSGCLSGIRLPCPAALFSKNANPRKTGDWHTTSLRQGLVKINVRLLSITCTFQLSRNHDSLPDGTALVSNHRMSTQPAHLN